MSCVFSKNRMIRVFRVIIYFRVNSMIRVFRVSSKNRMMCVISVISVIINNIPDFENLVKSFF